MDADSLDRTLKLELDEGRAATREAAEAIRARYVLQMHVGPDIAASETAQATVLTVANTATRAFIGGVRVVVEDDPVLSVAWARGERLLSALDALGARAVEKLERENPTLVIGEPRGPLVGEPVMHVTWAGWCGGVVSTADDRLADDAEMVLAGVLAGGLGVSEAFQLVRGSVTAGRRAIGASLWRPDLHWRDAGARGPTCMYLPSRYWLLGLGHLGQAYAWAIGCLPYGTRAAVDLTLQDFDSVVEANASTGLLVPRVGATLGERKARLVARRLERLGFTTAINERRFDEHTVRDPGEPSLALAGFDDPAPRRVLEGAGFQLVVDGGLGAGPHGYLDLLVHSFPSDVEARTAFESQPRPSRVPVEQPAYDDLVRRAMAGGLTEQEARCGILEIARQTAGAAFVGAVTSAVVLSEPLRALHGGRSFSVVGLSLRSPQYVDAVANARTRAPVSLGFVRVRRAPP